MKHSKGAEVIFLGSSLGRRKWSQWRKVETEVFQDQPNYNESNSLRRSKGGHREFLLLRCDGKYVGRAAAAAITTRLSQSDEKLGFIEDFVIGPSYRHLAGMLVGRCLTILEGRGVKEVIVRSHGFPALAASEFEGVPHADLPCNPSWYVRVFERSGFSKYKEWASFRFALPQVSEDGTARWESLLARTGARVGPISVRSRVELEQYSDLTYNVLVDHYGYTPSRFMDSYSLFKHVVIALGFPIVRSRIHVLRDSQGETIGFLSYHPDYRVAMKRAVNCLKRVPFPFTVLAVPPALVAYLLSVRRARRATIGAVGLGEEWRGRGLVRAIDYGLKVIRQEGYEELDSGPMLVENAVVVKMAESFAQRYGVRVERATYYTLRYRF
jgi:hypothetical protein